MRHPSRPDTVNAGIPAYIGLGSNLNGPAGQIQRAFAELGDLSRTQLVARSHLYKSKPLGPQDQPDYINAVAMVETQLEPVILLRSLWILEERHGRYRDGSRWGPRSLDLDLLIYGDVRMYTAELTLPHPGMHERSFVLYPLAELAPELVIPGYGPVRVLRDRCRSPAVEMLQGSYG